MDEATCWNTGGPDSCTNSHSFQALRGAVGQVWACFTLSNTFTYTSSFHWGNGLFSRASYSHEVCLSVTISYYVSALFL